MYRLIFLLSGIIITGHIIARSLNLAVYASTTAPFIVRFHSSCSSFWISPRGEYSSSIIAFRSSHTIKFVTGRVRALTWQFHPERALSENVQAVNLTLLSSGQPQISKTYSIFSNHRVRAMTPPLPLNGLDFPLVKSF